MFLSREMFKTKTFDYLFGLVNFLLSFDFVVHYTDISNNKILKNIFCYSSSFLLTLSLKVLFDIVTVHFKNVVIYVITQSIVEEMIW